MLPFIIIILATAGMFVAPTIIHWVMNAEFTRTKALYVAIGWSLGFFRK